ncbi:MAG TPA: hypothetical protein VKM55_24690 [Candidatus Lokiarchaeia archaeon]|nr:hypothetical protein [Candidatus Lokiarchaeia archaeon]
MDIHLADAKSAVAEAAYEVLHDKQDSLNELEIAANLTFGFKLAVEQEITFSIDLTSLIAEGKKELGNKIEDNQDNMDIERYALILGFKKNVKKLFEDFKGLFEEMVNCAGECKWKSGLESGIAFSIELKLGKKA